MLQLITKFSGQNALKFVGAWLIAHGYATQDQWTSIAGGIITMAGVVWHWYELHAHAQATGQVKAPALPASVVKVASALALAFGLLWVSGCGTVQSASYKAAGTTAVTVDTAMQAWGAYVATAHPSTNQEQLVKTAYERYQAGMAAVCDAGAIYASASQTNAPAASAALQTAIGNANNEISDLETLITSFGVKLSQ